MPLGAIGRKFSQNPIRTLGKDRSFVGVTTTTASSSTFGYNGSSQTYTISSSGIPLGSGSGIVRRNVIAYSLNLNIKAWGASGGGGTSNCFGSVTTPGGNGGFVNAIRQIPGAGNVIGSLKSFGSQNLVAPPAETSITYYVVVGQGGVQLGGPTFGGGGGSPGQREARSGGGASWVASAYPTTSTPQLYVVAGGGGGAGRSYGGAGGGPAAQSGGGQSNAGTGGFLSGNTGNGPDGSGGGGGFSGGGGGAGDGGDCRGLGGGGGTSYISPNFTTITNGITNTDSDPVTVTWSSDPDYGSSAGQGVEGSGNNGRVVIKMTYEV